MATRHTASCVLLAATLLMTDASAVFAQAPEAIRYTLSFPAAHTHYAEVTATVPTGRQPVAELMMAVWTPGSYMVREYSRNVEAVTAAAPDGRVLAVEKSEKNRWRVTTGGAPSITLKYRVYGREMSVRTNWIEAGFALINGAPTFITLADRTPRAHEVVISPAATWAKSLTGLPEMTGGPHRYRAPDFDTLADSPIVLGNPAVYEFTVDNKKHYLVNEGEGGVFDGPRAAKDLEAMVREHHRMWGSLPYDKYLFLNLLTETAGNGLEHKNSTVLMGSRWWTRTRSAYVSWLELASHEFFHVWNIKRLRPVELGPFDYENEVHTRSLWIAEGFTEYYGDLAVHRAGLASREEFLGSLSAKIEELQTTPGRTVQSVELASFDAWIKYYRPDENSLNTSISYYTKGAVAAFLLDAKIRKLTSGTRSLDDVMRAAYDKFAGLKGYTADEFRVVAEQVAGTSLKPFWDAAVTGTQELDYTEALDVFGLRFRSMSASADGGRAYLGASTRNDSGRLVVTQIRRDTPAAEAGLNVDDEILAIGDYRVRADRLDNRLEQYRPGDRVTLLVARREQLLRLNLTFGVEPARGWRLEVHPSAQDGQQSARQKWLSAGKA